MPLTPRPAAGVAAGVAEASPRSGVAFSSPAPGVLNHSCSIFPSDRCAEPSKCEAVEHALLCLGLAERRKPRYVTDASCCPTVKLRSKPRCSGLAIILGRKFLTGQSIQSRSQHSMLSLVLPCVPGTECENAASTVMPKRAGRSPRKSSGDHMVILNIRWSSAATYLHRASFSSMLVFGHVVDSNSRMEIVNTTRTWALRNQVALQRQSKLWRVEYPLGFYL